VAQYRGRDVARLVAGRGEILTLRPATGQRLLAELVLNPHRLRYCLTRTDPLWAEQMAEILALSWPPPQGGRILGLDEKTPIQARERLPPPLPLRPGLVERQAVAYRRPGPVDLFAALEGGTGAVFAPCYPRPPNLEFRHVLRALRARDPDRRWQLIVDNAGYHTKQAVLDCCAAHRPQVTLHWLPTHGSWLNHVAICFSLLSRKCVRRANVRSPPDWRVLIHRCLKTWNPHVAHPFAWT
jgi:DDE superfamily endonuclease